MKKFFIALFLFILATGCWMSPDPNGFVYVKFESNVPQWQRDVVWGNLAQIDINQNIKFAEVPYGSTRYGINVHGNFPQGDYYPCTAANVYNGCLPSMSYVDSAKEDDKTYRADLYLRPNSTPADIAYGVQILGSL
jgi:hypothetical protein